MSNRDHIQINTTNKNTKLYKHRVCFIDDGASVSNILKFSAINVINVMKCNHMARCSESFICFLNLKYHSCVSCSCSYVCVDSRVSAWVCVCVCEYVFGLWPTGVGCTAVLRLLSLVTDTRTRSPNAHRWMWYAGAPTRPPSTCTSDCIARRKSPAVETRTAWEIESMPLLNSRLFFESEAKNKCLGWTRYYGVTS